MKREPPFEKDTPSIRVTNVADSRNSEPKNVIISWGSIFYFRRLPPAFRRLPPKKRGQPLDPSKARPFLKRAIWRAWRKGNRRRAKMAMQLPKPPLLFLPGHEVEAQKGAS